MFDDRIIMRSAFQRFEREGGLNEISVPTIGGGLYGIQRFKDQRGELGVCVSISKSGGVV